jgi:hypothetical protein
MIKMSEPDAAVLARRSEIVAALQAIVPGEGVIEAERERSHCFFRFCLQILKRVIEGHSELQMLFGGRLPI